MKTEGETRAARNKDSERGAKRRPWPPQVREAVVRSVIEKGLSTFAVARKLGVPYTTAVMWVKAYRERGDEALKVRKPAPHPNWRLFLVVGFLGGFTTFSSFAYETFTAAREGSMWVGLMNVLTSVALGYLAVWLGAMSVGRR